MHNCETALKSIWKSATKLHGSIGISSGNNSITKGHILNNSVSVADFEEIVDLTQVISSQSNDNFDTRVSSYESNNGYTKCNYTDNIMRRLFNDNHILDL